MSLTGGFDSEHFSASKPVLLNGGQMEYLEHGRMDYLTWSLAHSVGGKKEGRQREKFINRYVSRNFVDGTTICITEERRREKYPDSRDVTSRFYQKAISAYLRKHPPETKTGVEKRKKAVRRAMDKF